MINQNKKTVKETINTEDFEETNQIYQKQIIINYSYITIRWSERQ